MSLRDDIKARDIRNAKAHLSNLLQTQSTLKEQLAQKDKEVSEARNELEKLILDSQPAETLDNRMLKKKVKINSFKKSLNRVHKDIYLAASKRIGAELEYIEPPSNKEWEEWEDVYLVGNFTHEQKVQFHEEVSVETTRLYVESRYMERRYDISYTFQGNPGGVVSTYRAHILDKNDSSEDGAFYITIGKYKSDEKGFLLGKEDRDLLTKKNIDIKALEFNFDFFMTLENLEKKCLKQ